LLNTLAAIALGVGGVFAFACGIRRGRPWGAPALYLCAAGLFAALVGVLYYYLLLALFGVMIYAYMQTLSGEHRWGFSLVLSCSLAIVALAVGRLMMTPCIFETPEAGGSAQDGEQELLGRMMSEVGRQLAAAYPGRSVLLLAPKADVHNVAVRNSVMVNALEQSLGGALKVAAVEEVEPGELQGRAEGALTAQLFDELLEKHGDCGVVVSSVGLPSGFEQSRFWQRPDESRARLVLVGDVDVSQLRKCISEGRVAMALLPRRLLGVPGTADHEPYVLVDAANLNLIPGAKTPGEHISTIISPGGSE
jgi:hypothetical protein